MEIKVDVRAVIDPRAKLGEGVLWDAQRDLVWFVDIKRHRLWHYDPASGNNGFAQAPDQIGWAIPAEEGLLLCGLKTGLFTFDPDSEQFERLVEVQGEPVRDRASPVVSRPRAGWSPCT